ncbi:MAG: tRNA (adenosine(37)-N6)-dimethylallyltransferase MiaA [Desulfobacterales bacterium]|nr:tRNA (adenosine(37)-N6)-dimethylallyltransferase MiaA [Desulfobacterales bacterium]
MAADPSVKTKVIVICGPTGIGKTELSLSLAEYFHGGIISADSMQVYRYMDIGTAKPYASERRRVPHFMIDVADPDEPYDAARYAEEAGEWIAALDRRKMVPFVVGGTGLYIKALAHGLCGANPSSPEIRERLRREAEIKGHRFLYERLVANDPEAAQRIHPNDSYRIIRALEVHESSGRPMSACQKAHGFADAPFDVLKICLNIERQALYERINRRVEQMAAAGLLGEVKSLLKMGYSAELKPMKAIGYRHMVDFIEGRIGWEATIDLMKRDTRRYAKRQLIWFKKDPAMVWMAPDDFYGTCSRIEDFLASSS